MSNLPLATFLFLGVIFVFFSGKNKIFTFFTIICLTVFSLIREEVQTPDYQNYRIDYFSDKQSFEFGYNLLKILFSYFDLSFEFFMSVICFIYLLLIFLFIRKASIWHNVSYIMLSLLFISYLYFLHGIVQIRVGLGISIALLFIYDKNVLKYLSFVFSVMIHQSLFVFSLYFMIKKFFISFKSKMFYLIFIAMSYFIGVVFNSSRINEYFSFLSNYIPKISHYYINTDVVNVFLGGKQILLILFFMYIICSSISREMTKRDILSFNVSFFSFCLFLLLSISPSISYRIFEMFEIFTLISFCVLFKIKPIVGLIFSLGYMALSIRAVFFITNPLINIG
ncbi:EpsG family protein [Photobacterium phosphoreum]|uniref:EpsG family protein n=1 Tax=Photobacterium phosphoreum TaxID=659 RepID=UPI00242C7A17|nr:EpsG family protein [Photobacterium phosphoreum]